MLYIINSKIVYKIVKKKKTEEKEDNKSSTPFPFFKSCSPIVSYIQSSLKYKTERPENTCN